MEDIIIEVKNLYKKHYVEDYVKNNYMNQILKSLFFKTKDKQPTLSDGEHWSLYDINFTLNKGDSLAILGDRESGKTLLLKILTNRLYCDFGTIQVPSKFTLMDKLRVGIDGNLTVHENIYLKSALILISKKEVNQKMDLIFEFAQLDKSILNKEWKYLTEDIRNKIMYSLLVVCYHDFFVVDGLTHIGNEIYAKKCKERIAQISDKTTFIIATRHSRKVKDICNKALILEKGKMKFFGEINDALKVYNK